MNDELEDGGNKSYSLLQYDHRDTSVSVTFSSYEIRDILNYWLKDVGSLILNIMQNILLLGNISVKSFVVC